MKPVRWGILGASKFAQEHMAPAMLAARHSRLVALATSDAQKAAPFKALESELLVFDHYDALLAHPDIDAVYVPLPHTLHVEWTQKALEAGKHVLTEKPIAMHADDIDTLIALRDQTGLVAAEAFMIVHHPQWHDARQLIQDGKIGALRRVDAVFTYDNSADPENIRNSVETGGGSLPDIGVYTLGCTRFATGQEPLDVAFADIHREHGLEVSVEAMVRFDGFTLTSFTSMRMMRHQYVTFHGTEGVIELPVPFNPLGFGDAELRLKQQDGPSVVKRYPGVNQYVQQIEAFGQAIRKAKRFPCSLEFSQSTQRLIDQIYATEG